MRRASAYLEAGADCVYPIALWETDALRRFVSEVSGLVNVLRLPQAPPLAELARLGVARPVAVLESAKTGRVVPVAPGGALHSRT